VKDPIQESKSLIHSISQSKPIPAQKSLSQFWKFLKYWDFRTGESLFFIKGTLFGGIFSEGLPESNLESWDRILT